MISPSKVLEAYAQTGLVPCKNLTLTYVNGEKAGCAMGALFMQKVGMANFHDHLENSRDVWKFAEELFGDDDMTYAVGFDHGYEGLESPNSSEIYLAGYECGRIVYEEFHGEASQSILSSSEEEEVHSPSETISMA